LEDNVEQKLKQIWQSLAKAHPILQAWEGIAWMGLTVVILMILVHVTSGTGLVPVVLAVGAAVLWSVYMPMVHPVLDPDFDLEAFMKDFKKFERWSKNEGLVLACILVGCVVAGNIMLAVLY
jgi:hypothetical protein